MPAPTHKRRLDSIARTSLAALVALVMLAGCAADVVDPTSTRLEPSEDRLEVVYTGCSCGPLWDALTGAYSAENPVDFVRWGHTHCIDAVQGVLDGTFDMACVGDFPNEYQDAEGLVFAPIAHDALVFAVSGDVGVDDLTTQQITDIFEGTCTEWSQVGGPETPIWVADRAERHGSRALAEEVFFGSTYQAGPSSVLVTEEDEVREFIEGEQGAIGYLSASLAFQEGAQMDVLAIDGVTPTPENVLEGDYPAVRHRGFVLSENADQRLLDFVEWLETEEVWSIVDFHGYVPDCECLPIG